MEFAADAGGTYVINAVYAELWIHAPHSVTVLSADWCYGTMT